MSKVIIGTGSDLPEREITNDEIEAMGVGYDRSRSGKSLDQWAMERMGIRSRHRIKPGEGTSDMGLRAAQRALEDAGLKPGDLGLIVMSTFTSDYRAPNSATLLQTNLGARCKAFQVDAGCTGFVEGTITAAALMDFMNVQYALVVSSDATSQYADPNDFMMQCLFGDGAGAVILQNLPDSPYGLKAYYTDGDASDAEFMWIPGGGVKEPITPEVLSQKRQYAQWSHHQTHHFALQRLIESAQIVAQRAGWTLDEVTWFIPHQTGRNVILEAARRLEQPEQKFIIKMDHFANTSGATIPIALDETNRADQLKDGDKLIMPAMGTGLAWGGLALVWHDYKVNRNNNGQQLTLESDKNRV